MDCKVEVGRQLKVRQRVLGMARLLEV